MRILPAAAALVKVTFAVLLVVMAALLTSAVITYGLTVESSLIYTVPTDRFPEVAVPSAPVVSSAILLEQPESE